MANRNERDGNDEKKREENATGEKDDAIQSEATPGADRDRDTAYNSSTSGGAADEIQDLSGTPPTSQRGRDMDH